MRRAVRRRIHHGVHRRAKQLTPLHSRGARRLPRISGNQWEPSASAIPIYGHDDGLDAMGGSP